jgi:hypothetical protein
MLLEKAVARHGDDGFYPVVEKFIVKIKTERRPFFYDGKDRPGYEAENAHADDVERYVDRDNGTDIFLQRFLFEKPVDLQGYIPETGNEHLCDPRKVGAAVRELPHDEPGKIGIGTERADIGGDDLPQQSAYIVDFPALRELFAQGASDGREDVFEDRFVQPLFGTEVVMEKGLVDIRLVGDRLHPRSAQSALNEDPARRPQDAFFRRAVLGPHGFIGWFNHMDKIYTVRIAESREMTLRFHGTIRQENSPGNSPWFRRP